MYFNRVDVEIPTDRGLSLLIDRHYNSAGTGSGKLGAKWRLGVEMLLSADGPTGDVTLTEGIGRVVRFRKHTLDFNTGQVTSYSPPYGVPYALSVNTIPNPDVYTVRLPDNRRLVFDGIGGVDSILDLAGNKTRFHYTAGGALDTIENASGRKVLFVDSSGLLRRVKSVPGDTLLVRYEYNASNLLKKVVYPDGGSEDYGYGTHAYDSLGITSAVTSDGVSRHWSYDSNGMADHFHYGSDSSEAVTFLDRDTTASGCGGSPDTLRSVVKHGKNSLTTDYSYTWSPDWSRRIVTGVQDGDCASCATAYTYDGIGFPKSAQFANGSVDEFRHDFKGNPVYVNRAANTPDSQFTLRTIDTLYNFNLPITERRRSVVTTETISVLRHFYSSIGALDSVIEAGRRDTLSFYSYTTRLSQNSAGQVTKIDGPRTDVSDTVGFAYASPSGDLLSQTHANGDVTSFGPRNSKGQRTWIGNPNGDTTRFTFDYRGRLTKVVYASRHNDSTAVSLSYNVDGQLTSVSNLQGSALILTYDAAGRLYRTSDLSGSFLKYTFDDMGNATSVLS